jgi:phosphoadenosine phosphosulfate reductase
MSDTEKNWTAEAVAELNAQAAGLDATAVLSRAIEEIFRGRIAIVSSFGADSAALLHLAAQIDRAVPVLFIDTGHLFPETLAYRDELAAKLGLTNIQTIHPDPADLAREDADAFLWSRDTDACCNIRKVKPLARAIAPYEAWISGRKKFQAATRAALELFELEGSKVKVNPLANWSAQDITDYMTAQNLPPHPLVAKNYLSIGCLPCTSPVRPGEDARAGRWRGKGKTECGIHIPGAVAGGGL